MPEGKSHVAPMGEAPTYVNTQRIPQQTGPATGSSAESSPRKDLFDMIAFPFAIVFFSFKAFFFFFKLCILFEICAITAFSSSVVLIKNAD